MTSILNTNPMRKAPLRVRTLLELLAVTVLTLLCFLLIPVIRPRLGYLPLPFAELVIVYLRVAVIVGLISLAIRRFVSRPKAIVYGFLIPFVALLIWAFDQQNLWFNLDLWKLFERGWFAAAFLAGLVGLLLALLTFGARYLVQRFTRR